MTKNDLSSYFNRHCRLRLRSGKEVFGVLWEHERDQSKLYFASHREHVAFRQKQLLQHGIRSTTLAQEVNPEDIIAVESL